MPGLNVLTRNKTRAQWRVLLGLFVAAMLCLNVLNPTQAARSQTVSAADWDAGNIISDVVFYNGNAMSEAEVQAFLDSNMPNCLPMSYVGPGNIGQYIAPQDRRECLNRYRMDTTTVVDPDGYCSPFYGAANDSAASILYKVGKACNVSQKALLVLLQKEQGLITDNWPEAKQYDRATGFGCYDNPFRCDANFATFFKQMYYGARQFQRYSNRDLFSHFPPVGQVWNIQWSTNSACGTGPVLVKNRATAALYYYTPYQPNATALSDMYAYRSDGCSEYGNRNFLVYYNNWFGSTQIPEGTTEFVKAAYFDVLGRDPDPTGLQYWVGRVAAGMSRADFSNFFNNSDEYRLNKINEAYRLAFSRTPDSGGQAFWLNEMRAGRMSPEDIYSTFLFSNEMYNVQGGGTNPGYVAAMYRNLLGRSPDSGGLAYWTNRLNAGEPRRSISDSIWYSPERYDLRVVQAYTVFLGRAPGVAEISYWAGVAKTRGSTAMRTGLMSSDEYFLYANVRY